MSDQREPGWLKTLGGGPPKKKAEQPDEKPRKCMICGYERYCNNCVANGDNHKAMFPQPDDCRSKFGYCPICAGDLDTGYECNKCGFDLQPYLKAPKRELSNDYAGGARCQDVTPKEEGSIPSPPAPNLAPMALRRLVLLKDHKDKFGKDMFYEIEQPKAWDGLHRYARKIIEAYEAAKEPLLLKKIAKEACVREEVAMWVLKAIGANYD